MAVSNDTPWVAVLDGSLARPKIICYHVTMPVSAEELNKSCGTINIGAVLAAKGITAESLACALKKELHAKETKFIKIRNSTPKSDDEGGPTNGLKTTTKYNQRIVHDGGPFGDTVLAVDCIAWGARQAARMDAQKLLNLYPATKIDANHSGKIGLTGISDDELLNIARGSGR